MAGPERNKARRLVVLGVLAGVCGVLGVLLVPHFAHRTYISDNSLLPGVATVTFGRSDMLYASEVTQRFVRQRTAAEKRACVLDEMVKIGLETYSADKRVVWGVLRAKSAEGKESIALATQTRADTLTAAEFEARAREQLRAGAPPFSEGLGITLAIARHLSQQKWLAKDFLFVVSMRDGGVEDWIDNYVARDGRAGSIQTALVLDIPPIPSSAYIDIKMRLLLLFEPSTVL